MPVIFTGNDCVNGPSIRKALDAQSIGEQNYLSHFYDY